MLDEASPRSCAVPNRDKPRLPLAFSTGGHADCRCKTMCVHRGAHVLYYRISREEGGGGSPIRWAGERREPHLAGSASAFSHGTDVFLHINPISRREHGFSCKYQRAHRPARSSQCRHRAALVPRYSGPLGQAAGRQGASQSAVAYRRRRILRQPRHEHRRSHHRPAAGFGMVGQQPELHLRIDDGVRLSDRWIVGRHRIGQVRAQEGTRVLRIAVLGVLPGGDLCPEHDRPHRLPVLHAILPDTGRSANTLPRRSEGATRRGSGSSPTAERLSRRSCA